MYASHMSRYVAAGTTGSRGHHRRHAQWHHDPPVCHAQPVLHLQFLLLIVVLLLLAITIAAAAAVAAAAGCCHKREQ